MTIKFVFTGYAIYSLNEFFIFEEDNRTNE